MKGMKSLLSLVLAALLTAQAAFAAPKPKPPQAEVFHEKIVKRGVDNWIAVKTSTGLELVGRITEINLTDFSMQLPNDPGITTIPYADIIDIRTGFTRGQKIFIASGIAGSVVFGIVAAIKFSDFKSQHPLPATPGLP